MTLQQILINRPVDLWVSQINVVLHIKYQGNENLGNFEKKEKSRHVY